MQHYTRDVVKDASTSPASERVSEQTRLAARETKTEKCRHGNSAFLLNTIFTDAVRRGAQFLQWRVREYFVQNGRVAYQDSGS